jgi:hypothetical protein
MSTRCQVQVIEDCEGRKSKVTLYHHTDGNPEYIIPKIYEAYCYEGQDRYARDREDFDFIKSRAGKIASLLCWSDPGVFEPEDHHTLHGDTDYFYRLFCRNSSQDRKPSWEIEIFKRDWHDEFDENWSHDQILKYFNARTERILAGITIDDFTLIQKRQSIVDLVLISD